MTMINTSEPQSFYKSVAGMLLSGKSDYLEALRRQFETAKVASIKKDGYGITINFEIDPLTRIVMPDVGFGRLDGLCGIDDKCNLICGFALFINDGIISSLDGFPFAFDAWPNTDVFLKFWIEDDNGGYYSDFKSQDAVEKYSDLKPIITGMNSRRFKCR